MDLNILWLIFITVLFGGFFFLEGFDFGVAVLTPLLGKNNGERRVLINAIGPFWDGNEVWLITAFGAIFAAFPVWYATLLSGFYPVIFIIIIALIFRGISFEFRSKVDKKAWQKFWDWSLCIGSLIPALLLGMLFTGLVKGVPINAELQFTGGIRDILTPVAFLAGIFGLLLFTYHGAAFLILKTEGEMVNRARKAARWIGLGVLAAGLILFILAAAGGLTAKPLAMVSATLALAAFIVAYGLMAYKKDRLAMIINGLTIILATAAVFAGMYPRVMTSSTGLDNSLTIYNAASTPYTLQIMTIVTLVFLPVVLVYQIWSYRVFRERLSDKKRLEY